MITKPTLTEKIIRGVSFAEEAFYLPKSDSQAYHWFGRYVDRKRRRKKAHERRVRKRVCEALKRLEKTKILSYSQDSESYRLTPKGWMKYMYYYSRRKPQSKKGRSKRVGRKYLVIFDIPETHRRFRDLLRQSLQIQGCRMIQKSVFACPNENIFQWAKKVICNCELDGHVLFIEAERVY